MDIAKITSKWLEQQRYQVQHTTKCPTIKGVVVKDLVTHLDGRGSLTELWSTPWVKKEGFVIPKHIYQSVTDYGVVKCWHLHKKHVDQFAVSRGKIQVTLVDLRKNSVSFGHVNPIFAGFDKPKLIKVPPGVLHGWKALSVPEVIVVNFQSHVYDPRDEYRFSWDCILKDVWEPING